MLSSTEMECTSNFAFTMQLLLLFLFVGPFFTVK